PCALTCSPRPCCSALALSPPATARLTPSQPPAGAASLPRHAERQGPAGSATEEESAPRPRGEAGGGQGLPDRPTEQGPQRLPPRRGCKSRDFLKSSVQDSERK